MKNLTSKLLGLLLLAAMGIVAYTIGKHMGSKDTDTKLINNHSFVKNIIELAGLQVSGTTTFKSSNADTDGGFWAGIKNALTENTATLTVPYTAKYGVAMADSTLQISVKDSVVQLTLPATQLLSFELHMDRMETSTRKGLLVLEDDEYYQAFQKKLYADARTQLAANSSYLRQSQQRIEQILQQYYQPLGLRVRCVFK